MTRKKLLNKDAKKIIGYARKIKSYLGTMSFLLKSQGGLTKKNTDIALEYIGDTELKTNKLCQMILLEQVDLSSLEPELSGEWNKEIDESEIELKKLYKELVVSRNIKEQVEMKGFGTKFIMKKTIYKIVE